MNREIALDIIITKYGSEYVELLNDAPDHVVEECADVILSQKDNLGARMAVNSSSVLADWRPPEQSTFDQLMRQAKEPLNARPVGVGDTAGVSMSMVGFSVEIIDEDDQTVTFAVKAKKPMEFAEKKPDTKSNQSVDSLN